MANIQTKPLGKNGPQVPVLGFGAMGLSLFYGAVDADEQRLAVLDRAYELGSRHWDTADMYGDNELVLGKWFAKNPEKRADIFLATKFAAVIDDKGNYGLRSDAAYVRESIEKSLTRLGVEYIDLYYCHRVDGVTPIEDTVKAMVELQKEGKIRHIGFSEVSANSLKRACAVAHVAALQTEYSPFELSIEDPKFSILATAQELGVAIVAYSPLARGFLTGKYKSIDDFEEGDFRRMLPRFAPENFEKNLLLLNKFEEIATKKGCTSGQLALAWLVAQGDYIFTIAGTKKIKYLEENMGANDVILTKVENDEIRSFAQTADVQGSRAPAGWFSESLYADTPMPVS